jgi:hypothetical protein
MAVRTGNDGFHKNVRTPQHWFLPTCNLVLKIVQNIYQMLSGYVKLL